MNLLRICPRIQGIFPSHPIVLVIQRPGSRKHSLLQDEWKRRCYVLPSLLVPSHRWYGRISVNVSSVARLSMWHDCILHACRLKRCTCCLGTTEPRRFRLSGSLAIMSPTDPLGLHGHTNGLFSTMLLECDSQGPSSKDWLSSVSKVPCTVTQLPCPHPRSSGHFPARRSGGPTRMVA